MSGPDVHKRAEESFSAYLDGDLPDDRKAALEEHLRTCIQCRTHLERLRRTMGGLAALRRKAPPTFLPDIQKQIHQRSRGRFFSRRWLLFGRVPFEWVSLGLIVAMLVYYIIATQGAPGSVSPAP